MGDQRKIIKVGSRKSQLALIQTNNVISMLKERFPSYQFEIETISTTGDKILDIALSKIGEKALFTKELEIALEEKRVDFVVHSLKDLPTVLPDGMVIGAVCKRDPAQDAVVMHPKHRCNTMADLPPQSVVGTSSLRRSAQVKKLYPHLQVKDVRGNLNTRLTKLDDAEDYDCLLLAAAGLERMGWHTRTSQVLDGKDWLYAVSQGAMAVECREGDTDTLAMLELLHHEPTLLAVVAERAFLKTLEGGCSVPVGVYCEVQDDGEQDGGRLLLKGGVFSTDGAISVIDTLTVTLPQQSTSETAGIYSCIVSKQTASLAVAERLGQDLAQKLIEDGAGPILRQAKSEAEAGIRELAATKAAAKAKNSGNGVAARGYGMDAANANGKQ